MYPPDPTPHLERFESHEQACQQFRCVIPGRFNIASEICRRHADAVTRIALGDVKEGGVNTYTFGGLDFLSDKFATALSTSGVRQGDSVAVALPPSAALIVAHLGALKVGAVVTTIPLRYDAALTELALRENNARALVIDESSFDRVERFAENLPDLDSRFVVRDLRSAVTSTQVKDFWAEIDRASSQFEAVETNANSAAFIFYIDQQGETTAVVHSHRSAIAQLAGFEVLFDVQSDGARGTGGDWSPGAFLGLLYPSLWYGCSVVAGSADEIASGRDEVYGKPETGWITAKCKRWFNTPDGSAGRRVPGRLIDIIDETGSILPPGQVGHVAVHKSDPALFTGYHCTAEKTAPSFIGEWFITGDAGYKSGDGEFYIER
jgi:acyl-coenzyme A synthetase/AMP-(fatty) acid ligase